ncbi:MAG: DUF4345 family protein [Pseudomonadota bacterium]
MDFIQFTMPETFGETMAWLTALASTLIGLTIMIAPSLLMRFVGLTSIRSSGISEVRSVVGGLFTGLGLACLMLSPQPLLYFALGLAFAAITVGRIISFVADRSLSPFTIGATVMEGLSAFFPLAYVFGILI